MFRSALLRGASACALTFAFAPDMTCAQEALPTIDIGASRGAQPEKPESPGAADKFGNLPKETYVTPNASTATKMDVPLRDVPQSVKVITPQLIEDQGPQLQVYDLANQVSGVIGDPQGGGSGTHNTPLFTVRGFPTGGPILLDGMPRNYGYVGTDLSDIDHVEFAKGPSSTLYGAVFGFGGIVNFITKKPTDRFFAIISEGIGSFGFHRTTIDLNTPLREDKSVLFRLNAAFEERGFVNHYDYHDGISIAPALTWIFDNGDKLSFHGKYGVNHDRASGGLPLYPVFQYLPRERYFGDLRANQNNTLANATIKYEHAFDENWNITAIADYGRTGTLGPGFAPFFDGVSTIYENLGVNSSDTTDGLVGQVDLRGKFNTGPVKHNILFGLYRQNSWDKYYSTMNFSSTPESINIFYPIYPADQCFVPTSGCSATWLGQTTTTWLSAVYGQDLVEVTDQFKLLIGGRYDHEKQWTISRDPANLFGNGDNYLTTPQKYSHFSPHIGGVFQPFEETSIFAAWGQTFNPNNGNLTPGHPAPPQFADQYDVGVKQELFGGKVQVGATAFDITKKNLLTSDPTDPSGQRSILIGKYRSHGLEFDVGGEIFSNLRVNVAATFMHGLAGKDLNNLKGLPTFEGSELSQSPRRFYNFSGVYAFKDGALKGLEVGASFYYASKTPALYPNSPEANAYAVATGALFGPNQYPFMIAPIYNVGLLASYQVNDRLKIQVNANNLLDRANWKSSGGQQQRGEPRSIFANITYKFE
ncbi:TonB-dependent siderophore receptor [Methylosinus sp. LW4]|uniref:TonB-dependent siderophore receptor n=1 Tax=Methylosinus sp. LW4 TaxID=136993 RepID=UPI0003809C85|nr:TonB-dependent receptor [Methylosinus sp. LW4]